MLSFRTLFVALSLAVTFPTLASAADPEKDFVTRVNRAIEKGKKFLIEREGGKGNWEGLLLETIGDQVGGQTALATLALLTSGVPAEDKVVQRGLDYLRKLEPRKTYVVALSTMAFAEAKQKSKDLDRIQKNTEWLLANSIRDKGKLIGWSYPSHIVPDASNTQYALLGLYAAKQAGVKIDDKHWEEIRDLYIRIQKPAGHWVYNYSGAAGGLDGPSFSMTTAGVCGLLIAGMGLNDSQQQLNEITGVAANCGVYTANEPLAKGMKWISDRFSFDTAPGLKSVYYNVYGLERLGRISGQRFIGKYDWYREGCDYLTRVQNDNGSWVGEGGAADRFPTISTSFALMFLAKGKTPILLTKLAFDTLGDPDNVIGWNRKQSDVRNLTEFASRELFNGTNLAWQVYDGRKIELSGEKLQTEVESLLACPVVYFNGHTRPNLTGAQRDLLKKYVDEGGFVLAEACCGSEEYTREFRALMRELFPESKLEPMKPEHAIWRSFFSVSPADIAGVECMERGCKTVVVLCTKPLAGYWEENRFMVSKGTPAKNQGQRAYQFAGNVIAYATGMQPPEQRGTKVAIAADPKKDLSPPRSALKPAQLVVQSETPPAPAAMRNLMAHVKTSTGVDTVLAAQLVRPNDPELDKYKFIYLHGRKEFDLSLSEVTNLAACLDTGGLLFADAACGKPGFDKSFRELVPKLFEGRKLEPIPVDDELYSAKINGVAITSVQRREKSDGTGTDGGYKDLPPLLEGVKIDGRWVVIYSKYDIGCALERHKSTECLGHTPESALKLATAAVLYSLKR
ncbi:DUF4159 domain-containing protein [Limnoglobus roseus]|uniref:DUF4159 domain-containing protein n=1 Tax=Limnoglobus roseus TaxID=2598579 RepID=A0A5C1AJ76_9BACT|nr:DUF4159 domain-containing protein [Limnoglobus roseus]QEL18233.1 hypothetical protein PX52LOC_05249 [Limnoglobus roseus]